YKKVIQTFNYRDPAGIMLDFQYNTIAGEVGRESAASSIDENGTAESEYKTVQLTDGRKAQTPPKTFDSIPLIFNERAREELKRDLVGSSITTPSTAESSVKQQAHEATENRSFMGFITVKLIGHPDFQPNVYGIDG